MPTEQKQKHNNLYKINSLFSVVNKLLIILGLFKKFTI